MITTTTGKTKRISTFNLASLTTVIILILLSFFIALPFKAVAAQIPTNSPQMPLSPPVKIEFTTENTPKAGEELTLKLKITPEQDMHADISSLLPQGIKPVREKGIILRPYRDRHRQNKPPRTIYPWAIQLWVGPLKANITKEFTFRITIPGKQRYELITRVEALAKWGVKEKILIIDTSSQ